MLTYEDCLNGPLLTDDEVRAVVKGERVPDICEAEYSAYVVESPDGLPVMRDDFFDDLHTANALGDEECALRLRLVLWHFVATHPDNPSRLSSA